MPKVRRTEIEEELKRALPAYGEVIQFHPLIKGHGHQSFILETSSKTNLLLKIALRSAYGPQGSTRPPKQIGGRRALRATASLASRCDGFWTMGRSDGTADRVTFEDRLQRRAGGDAVADHPELGDVAPELAG